MTPPLLTFAIPFRGRVDHLREALASAQAQTDARWLAIVVDDANPDPGAGSLVATLGDPRIRYCRNPVALGLAANWNYASRLATTPLVTLFHGDDMLEPAYVATMLAAHEKHPDAAAIFCDATTVDASGTIRSSLRESVKRWLRPGSRADLVLYGESGVCALLRGNFILCPTLCYRSTLFLEREFDPGLRWVPDLAFTLRLLFGGHRVVGLNERMYRYRRHSDQASKGLENALATIEEECFLWSWAAREADSRDWRSALRTAEAMRFVRLHAAWMAANDLLRGRFSMAIAKWQYCRRMRSSLGATRRAQPIR